MIYTANSTVTVEGKSYRPGDSVDIQDASAAKELLAVGFIVTLPGEYAPGETRPWMFSRNPRTALLPATSTKRHWKRCPRRSS